MVEAHYFHATLYRFVTPEARTVVVTRFNAAITDISARCWYDVETDAFQLTCSQDIGSVPDECLGMIIDQYIQEELQAAERDGRPAQVERFHNVFLDEVAPDADLVDALESASEPTSLPSLPPKLSTVFAIDTEGVPWTQTKFLQSRDMPTELVGRILVDPTNQNLVRAVSRGYRACAVRWDDRKDAYVFNGRLGRQSCDSDAMDDLWRRALDLWPSFQGTREEANTQFPDALKLSDGEGLRQWKFKGQKPTVSQWLSGVGEIEPDMRQEESELPHDTKRMLASSVTTYDTVPLGRIRLPPGTSLLPPLGEGEQEDDSEDSECEDEANPVDFNQLLSFREPRQRASHDSCLNLKVVSSSPRSKRVIAGSSSATDISDEKDTPRPDIEAGSAQMPCAPARSASRDGPISDKRGLMPAMWELIKDSATEDGRCNTHEPELYPNSSASAIIDGMGLKGNATIQARWELDHPITNRKNTRNKPAGSVNGLRLRNGAQHRLGALKYAESTDMASVTNTSDVTQPVSGPCDQAGPWSNVMGPRAIAISHELVDTFYEPSSLPLKLPPGLPAHPKTENLASLQGQSAHVVNARVFSNDAITPTSKQNLNLIDLDGGELRGPPKTAFQMSFYSQSLEPFRKHERVIHAACTGITESLAKENEEPPLRYTMRQQAGKKNKHKPPAQGSHAHVQLPLPDWTLPPPKASKQQREKTNMVPLHPAVQQSNSATRSADVKARRASDPSVDAESEQIKLVVLERFLRDVKLLDISETSQIVVQFGKTYFDFSGEIPQYSDLADWAKDISSISSQPQVAFLPRLTQSHAEAFHIHKLVAVPAATASTPIFSYVVHVRSVEGRLHVLRYQHGNPNPAAGTRVSSDYTTVAISDADAYILFPYRPFDAHITMETHTTSDVDAMMVHFAEFIASARSTAAVSPGQHSADPSFEAYAPIGLRVEKIYAKTCFRGDLQHHSTLEVVRVHELRIEPIASRPESGKSNMKASVISEDITSQWWEVQLRIGLEVDAKKLVAATESVLKEMDSIGLANQGLWEVESPAQPNHKETAKSIVVPHW